MPEFIDLRDLAPRALAAVHNVLNYVDSVQVQEPDKSFPLLNPNEDAISDIGPARWAIFLRLSVSLLQPPTKLPRWLESCHQHDSRRLAKICSPSESAPALRSLLTLICRRLERPDFDLSTSVSRLQVFLGVYFDELHVPDSFGAEQPKPWSDVLNAESLGPTIAWLTLRLKSDVRSRETAWGDAVELIVKLMAISEHTGDFGEIPPVAVKSSEILGKFWISCFSYRLHASQFLVPQGSLDADGLTNIKTAIAALASDPPPQIDGRKALSLCDDLCFSLYNDHRDGRASNLVPAWRGVFDALTQLVQHTQVEDSDAAMRLVNWCFSRIEGFDGINNSDDDAEYAAWLATFKSEDSPVPDEFILELLRINSNPHYPLNEEESYLRLWRVRRLNELSNNAQSQPKGTAIPYTPGTTLPTSDVDGDNQGNTPQSSASAADGGNIQTDPTALPPVNSHLSYSPSETSLEAQHAETDALIGHPPNDSTPEPVPTDSSDALSYVNIHDLRYPPAGDQAAPTDSSDALSYVDVNETPCDPPTAVQGSEEAGSFEITPAESNHDEEMTPHFEGVPTAVEPIMNDEAESAAATAIPVEDATDPRQTEAVQDHAPNSDHDRRPSTPAPSATLDSTSVLPTEIDEESHLAQDVRSEDRGVQPGESLGRR
ncbi:hypothetical protein BDW22DRAFT_699577 [Trametopsis cervina]|nr:hypothetical protein BDW22DRAFT_699577 [Trametopsis cervina]